MGWFSTGARLPRLRSFGELPSESPSQEGRGGKRNSYLSKDGFVHVTSLKPVLRKQLADIFGSLGEQHYL
jgi:hypothetical protein